jgi:hypothetical protein
MSKKGKLDNATKLKKLKSLANQVRKSGVKTAEDVMYAKYPKEKPNIASRGADAMQELAAVASYGQKNIDAATGGKFNKKKKKK